MKAIRIILACLRKADETYKLIAKGDKIVVGISGGKDSMALLFALHQYKKFAHTDFQIFPVMLDLGFPNFNADTIIQYVREIGYELTIVNSKNVYPILEANKKQKKHIPCSICSRMKKAIINSVAKSLGATKVAFAHHMDDAVETLFMNIFYAGKIATFEPKMYLNNARINFVRPLILCKEQDIIRLIEEENIPIIPSFCPADKMTNRNDIKEWLKYITKNNLLAKKNIYTALQNDKNIKLWKK